METVTLVRQYARALFVLAGKARTVDRIAAELEAVDQRIRSEPEIDQLLSHPETPPEAKREILRELIPEGTTGETTAFLSLLVQRRYMRLLPDVIKAFIALREASFGVLKAEVEAARPLSRELREQLKDVLARATGRGVVVVESVNPDLIGGLRVRIGDRIVDASVTGRLEHMKEQLLRSGLPTPAA